MWKSGNVGRAHRARACTRGHKPTNGVPFRIWGNPQKNTLGWVGGNENPLDLLGLERHGVTKGADVLSYGVPADVPAADTPGTWVF